MVDATILKNWMMEDNGTILPDPKHQGIFTGYVTFTPERAESALENNTKNRKLGLNTQVPMLRAMLRNGLWDDNVSKVNFEKDNTLSDGQNRLHSIVQEQISARCLVTWGVEKTAQMVTDRRGTRSLSDDIEIAGYPNANRLAAMTRVMYSLNVQHLSVKQIITRSSKSKSEIDPVLLAYFLNNDADIIDINKLVMNVMSATKNLDIDKSLLNVLVPVFNDVNEADAHCFWHRLSIGGGTEDQDDPIVRLSKRLADNAANKTAKLPKITEGALIIKSWNLFVRGEKTGTLKYTAGGANPELFPKIYNPYTEVEIE